MLQLARSSGSGRLGELFAFHADRLGPTRTPKGEIMADLSALIGRFIKVVERYLDRYQFEQITEATLAVSERNRRAGNAPNSPHLVAKEVDLPLVNKLTKHQRDRFSAGKALRKIGRVLAKELERQGENSTELRQLVNTADRGGGGPPAALGIWQPLKANLERIADRAELQAEGPLTIAGTDMSAAADRRGALPPFSPTCLGRPVMKGETMGDAHWYSDYDCLFLPALENPSDVLLECQQLRGRLSPDNPDRELAVSSAPDWLKRLWHAMRQVGGAVPESPVEVLTDTRANRLGKLLHDDSGKWCTAEVEKLSCIIDSVVAWCVDKGGKPTGNKVARAESVRLPEDIEKIQDPGLRQRTTDAWYAVNDLLGCVLPWRQWLMELRDRNNAHPGKAILRNENVARCADILTKLRIDSPSFNGATVADIVALFPPKPSADLAQPELRSDDGAILFHPAIQSWQEAYPMELAQERSRNLWKFEGELLHIRGLLETAPSVAFLTEATDPPSEQPGAKQNEGNGGAGLDIPQPTEPDLNGTETAIVNAMGKHGITSVDAKKIGVAIARLAKVTFNTNCKTALVNLKKQGFILNPGRGYYLSPKGVKVYESQKVMTKSGSK